MKRQLKSRAGLLLRGRPVALAAPENDNANDKARWIQVAEEGLYLGHKSSPFEFNEIVFDQIIANFRRLPEYQRGADGWGCNRVIPFDWDHASERKTGTIEQQAAQGWAWDVDKRRGPDGKLELWSLAEALEPAKTLIREGKIAWTSVAVWPDATDQITGENIGYYMSSIAWTNDPFIRGMVPIAASRDGQPLLADTQYIDPWVRPCSAAECIEALRRLFGLPLQADLGQVLGELAKLKATVAGQQDAAPGVDVLSLVKALRQLFNLPTMATPQEVFAETDKLLGSLAADEELVPSSKQPRLNSNEGISMDEKQLMAILAGRLAVPANAQAVHDAVAKKLDDQSATLLGRAREVAITFAKGGSDPMGLVKGILGALGMQEADITAACDKIGNTFAMAKQLTDLMPEFAKMYEGRAAAEDEAAEGDVRQAMSMSRVPDSMQPDVAISMMWSRTGGIDLPRLPRRADGTIDHTLLLDESKRKAMFSALESREAKRAEFAQKVQGNGPTLFGRGGNGQPQHASALFQRWFAQGQQQGGGMQGVQSLFGRQGQGLFGGQHQGGAQAAAWPGQNPMPMGQGLFGRPQQGPALFDPMRQAQAPTIQIDGVEIPVPDLSEAGGIQGANETERAKNYLLSNGYKGEYDALMARSNMLAEAYVHSSQPQGSGRF